MTVCYLGIGSNCGNRRAMIAAAVRELRAMKGIQIQRVSTLIETVPVGGPKGQGDFLNGAVKISTTLTPRALLLALKRIEKKLGRVSAVRWGPRLIDLDILLYGSVRMRTKTLTIPHPRMFQRTFVLEPLSELIWS